MKFFVKSAAIAGLGLFSFSPFADTLFGVHGELQYWHATNKGQFGTHTAGSNWDWDGEGASRLTININHFLPFVPNVQLEKQLLESKGTLPHLQDFTVGNQTFNAPIDGSSSLLHSNWDLGHDALTVYYRLFDNDAIQFHFGASGRKMTGDFYVNSANESYSVKLDETIVLGYVRATVGLPFSNFSFRVQGYPVSFGSHNVYDMEASVRYQFMDNIVLDGHLSAGYRIYSVELDSSPDLMTNFELSGAFVSLALHF